MGFNCSMCLDLYTQSSVLCVPPCGHVFHENCLTRWVKSKPTCPQCREPCPKKELKRIFFHYSNNTSSSQNDTAYLRNKVDDINAKLMIAEESEQKYKEECEESKVKLVALRAEYRTLEKKLRKCKEDIDIRDDRLKLAMGERERARLARKEADELKSKLEFYETVKAVLDGTLPQMMDRLHGYRDYSKETKEMCHMVELLKKQLAEKTGEYMRMHSALQSKSTECADLRSKWQSAAEKLEATAAALHRAEEEKKAAGEKLEKFQAAVDSPSGDPRASALKRLVTEFPAPSLGRKTLIITSPSSPPKKSANVNKPSSSLVGLARVRSPCKNVSNSLFVKKHAPPDVDYNGLGGHSRPDSFPVARRPLKAKQYAKPKTVDKKAKLIDKYFAFDTP